jgi:hypothetical protein
MPWNQIVSIIANLVGVLAPLAVIVAKFGTHTSVNAPGDPLAKVLYIGLAVVFAYVCSLLGSLSMRKSGAPTLMQVSRYVVDIRGKRS